MFIIMIMKMGIVGVCEEGDIDKINELINKGAFNWSWGLEGACKGGNMDIIKLMIEKAEAESPKWRLDLCCGFYNACEGGYMDIVKLIIEKAEATKWRLNFYHGFYWACIGGKIEIVKLLISKYIVDIVNHYKFDWNKILCSACKGGNIDIVNLIMDKATNVIDKRGTLNAAFLGKNNQIIDLMLSCGAYTKEPFPKEYIEYKQKQVLKYTKMHESLIDMILKYF